MLTTTATTTTSSTSKTALLIVDIQNDFCEGGSLAVPLSIQVIQKINEIRQNHHFDVTVCTKDYHPSNHVSFAVNHPNQKPFTTIILPNGKQQELWPVHCVQNEHGSELHKNLILKGNETIVLKGTHSDIDSYSGFGSEGEQTGLVEYLNEQNVTEVFVCGLAYDFCVGSTAIDSAKNGFNTKVIKDATGEISKETAATMDKRFLEFADKLKVINSSEL